MDQCWNDIAMVMPVAAVMAGLGLRPSTAPLQIRDQGDHRSNTEHNIQPAQLLLSYNLVFPGNWPQLTESREITNFGLELTVFCVSC